MTINLDISGSKDLIYVDEQDTSTSIVFYIKDNGSAVDLTGLTLSFVLHRTSYIVAPLTITSASSGIATFTLTSAMTASPGTLVFEVVGMGANDTPEFDISSYMVVQKVYSGSDGQNDPDEENPGIDVLYGEDVPDAETDGQDKDFYFELSEGSGHVINENDYEAYTDATHPISITSFTRVSDTEYNFDITGKPSNDGNGENIFINLTGLIEGEQYTITFDAQYSSGTTFPYYPQYDSIADIRNGTGTSLASEVLQSDTQKHSHTITFTASAVNKLHFFLSSKDNVSTTLSITDLIIDGDIQFIGEIEEFYNKHQSKWLKYNRVKEVKVDGTSVVTDDIANINTMTGATSSTDGTKGLVPQPTSADYLKYLRGDGTWQDAQGASAVSDLTDVELTNLADGEILKYNATASKWENATESGGGGGGGIETHYGTLEPTSSVGSDGDLYLQTGNSFCVFNGKKTSNAWVNFIHITADMTDAVSVTVKFRSGNNAAIQTQTINMSSFVVNPSASDPDWDGCDRDVVVPNSNSRFYLGYNTQNPTYITAFTATGTLLTLYQVIINTSNASRIKDVFGKTNGEWLKYNPYESFADYSLQGG